MWLLWPTFDPGLHLTGWMIVLWLISWLPGALLGSIAAISGLILVHRRSVTGGERLVVLTLSRLTIILNITVVILIFYALLTK